MANPNPADHPALYGWTVTEAHTKVCREKGHATYKIDGKVSPACPRCGQLLAG